MPESAAIIVGLGNPGQRYANTRHNAGFRAVDALSREISGGVWISECRSLVRRGEIAGRTVVLAKPMTFMNLSGLAVRDLLEASGGVRENLVVLVDDLYLALGRIRVRASGSSGGHNGLESIFREIESQEFARVRLGVGEENMPEDRAAFALADFSPMAQETLEGMIGRAAGAVKSIITEGLPKAMSVYNVMP